MMLNIKILIIIGIILISTSAIGGTIMLMGMGLATPGSAPPSTCSDSLDFTDSCNSQYITVI